MFKYSWASFSHSLCCNNVWLLYQCFCSCYHSTNLTIIVGRDFSLSQITCCLGYQFFFVYFYKSKITYHHLSHADLFLTHGSLVIRFSTLCYTSIALKTCLGYRHGLLYMNAHTHTDSRNPAGDLSSGCRYLVSSLVLNLIAISLLDKHRLFGYSIDAYNKIMPLASVSDLYLMMSPSACWTYFRQGLFSYKYNVMMPRWKSVLLGI